MQYKTYIFDLDGTILDTLEDLCDTMNHCLKLHNMKERTLSEIRSFVGNGIKRIVERSVEQGTKDKEIEEILGEFNNYYKDHCAIKTKPYPGIIGLMKELKANGKKIAVVSNKADYAVKSLCNDYFKGLVDYSIGAKDNQRKKPYPDSVFDAINYLNENINNCVYVGDSEVDIETAKNAGIDLIMVSWGFRDEEYLISLGANVIVHNPTEILDRF